MLDTQASKKQVSSNLLFKAADRGDLNRVKKLVNEGKEDPMQTSKSGGYSALHYAARKGKLNIIMYLIAVSYTHLTLPTIYYV